MRTASLCAALAAAALLCGCGSAVYRPNTAGEVELDPALEINDEDVRKAFEARPQLQPSFAVAYYSFDPKKVDELDAMLRALPGVRSTYRIPPLLATGERRFTEASPWAPPKPVSVKKLRLLAARAHADVLMIFDYGYKVERPANGLATFGVVLVPLLFLPFLDLSVESYLEAFVMDTRNGYLYGHLSADEKDAEDYVSSYSARDQQFIDRQWSALLAGTSKRLGALLAAERQPRPPAALKAAPPPAEPPRPPSAPPEAAAPTSPEVAPPPAPEVATPQPGAPDLVDPFKQRR